MTKLKSRSRARRATAAGLTTGAVGAALLVAPTAAFAAVTVTPQIAPPLSNVTIVDSDLTPFVNAAASRVQLLTTGTTCAATIGTVGPTILTTAAVGTATPTTVVFTLPSGATAGTNGQAKKYLACVYEAAGTGARQGSASGYPVWVGNAPTVNPAIGTTGGGTSLTVTAADGAAIFTGVTTVGAAFATGACPVTLGTPAAGTSAPVTRESNTSVTLTVPSGVTSATATPTAYNLCLYSGATSAGTLISSVAYSATQLALSQATGPYQGLNGLNITSPNQFLAGIDSPGVIFSTATCPSPYTQTEVVDVDGTAPSTRYVPSANVRKLTNTRLAVTVPALLASAPGSSLPFNVCVYNGQTVASSTLIASTVYTATTVHASTGITPKAGPALGGSRIIVTGTAFPIEPGLITATLGGAPLTDITPISATAFEATTPQHAPANNVALVVSTAAGQHILPNAYSYNSALIVIPNTAPNTRAVDVIVNGVGFQSASWSSNLETGSHIFLVEGSYSSSAVSGERANPAVAECGNVLVLGDNELICNLNLARRLDKEGETVLDSPTPIAAAALGIATAVGSRAIVGTGFTEELIGMTIAETGNGAVPAGTTIIGVINATNAVMSNTATDTEANISGQLLPPVANTVTITTNDTPGTEDEIVATVGTFSSADVGKFVNAAGVPVGTTIATFTDSTHVVLSANASAAATVPATVHSRYVPVPEGAYNLTYVSNAAVNAVGSDAQYVQSQVSSGSTFTVSSF